MSYQYPSTSHNSAAMDMQHSTYMSDYPSSTNSNMEVRPLQQPQVPLAPSLPAQPPAPLLPPSTYPILANHSPLAKRRESLSKAFLKPRRSHSTPNVRPQGMNESDTGGLNGEKKRSKLGYARTNMACGNCRRRKIRCEPSKNDPRCAQCLRLGKDCQFYAVDQPPPPPSGGRSGSRALPRTNLTSAATSPPIALGHPGDMQAHQSSQGRVIPLRPGAPSGRAYSYGQSMGWDSTATSPNTVKHEDVNASWRGYPPGSSVAPGFAPFPVATPQTSATWATSPLEATVGSDGTSRHTDSWSPYQQPTRSMSFNGEQSVQYAATPATSFDRKASVASDMYHPTTMEGMPQASYAAWQQPYQPWYAEGGQPVSSPTENPSQMDGMYYGR